jgi:hypothetical protein
LEWVFVILFVAAAALAIRVRHALEDPLSPFGHWFDKHARPRLKQAAMAVFGLTLLGWFAVYLTAPAEDRKGLTETFQDLWKQFDADKARFKEQREGGGKQK